MLTPQGGEDVSRLVVTGSYASLEALYAQDLAFDRHEQLCGPDLCDNVALWRVVWDMGACLCVPREVCAFGKLLVEEAMDKLWELVCNACGMDLVPAIFLPISSIG